MLKAISNVNDEELQEVEKSFMKTVRAAARKIKVDEIREALKAAGITETKDNGKTLNIAGKVVEVQKESAAETALNDEEHADLMASFAQLLSVGEYNTAFMDLESGAVDAVAIDIGVAQFQIEGKEDQYQILDETISSEQYAVGFFLGNTALRDEVQSTLLEMVEDGTFAEISNQYFGYDVCTLGK